MQSQTKCHRFNDTSQVKDVTRIVRGPSAYVSVFAGRIADTGRDPMDIMKAAVDCLKPYHSLSIWASPRELFNIFQADHWLSYYYRDKMFENGTCG